MQSDESNILGISLSILVAAAVAHAMNLISTSVPIDRNELWVLFSLIILLVTIVMIFYAFDVKFDIKNIPMLFKVLFMGIFTLIIFSISRFIYFYDKINEGVIDPTTNIYEVYDLIFCFILIFGLFMIILSGYYYYTEKKENIKNDGKKSVLFWSGFMISIFSILFILFLKGYILNISGG